MMTLAYPLLPTPITFEEGQIPILVIENSLELRRLLFELRDQIRGSSGTAVLAEYFTPIEMEKYATLVTDMFSIDFSSRKLSTKIYESACKTALAYTEQLQHSMMELNWIASQIAIDMDFETEFSELDDPNLLVKQFCFCVDTEELSFTEQLLLYIKMQERFLHKKLTILYNVKSCLSPQELECFYQTLQYEKLTVLLIEDMQRHTPLAIENMIVVDKDLCVF